MSAESRVECPNQIVRPYSYEDLEAVFGSEQWKCLVPNYPERNGVIHPKLISADFCERVVDGVTGSRSFVNFCNNIHCLGEVIEIPDYETLYQTKRGESKLFYEMQSIQGDSLAVLVLSGYNLGIQVPEDPHIYRRYVKFPDDGFGWEYNDLRTYLILPVEFGACSVGICFQEFGGYKPAGVVGRKVTEAKVRFEIARKGYGVGDVYDLKQDRHYLQVTYGGVAVIGISLKKRV
jgi:hypothetical protein